MPRAATSDGRARPNSSAAELESFVERIERIREEKAVLAQDEKDVLTEAKGLGYDVKTIKRVLKIRKEDPEKRQQEEYTLDVYLHALGLIDYEPDAPAEQSPTDDPVLRNLI